LYIVYCILIKVLYQLIYRLFFVIEIVNSLYTLTRNSSLIFVINTHYAIPPLSIVLIHFRDWNYLAIDWIMLALFWVHIVPKAQLRLLITRPIHFNLITNKQWFY